MSAPDAFALMMDAKQRMEDADRAFSAALQARYGSKAGDVRYRNAEQSPEVFALGETYRSAAEAWMQASQAHRANHHAEGCGRELLRVSRRERQTPAHETYTVATCGACGATWNEWAPVHAAAAHDLAVLQAYKEGGR